MSIKDCFAQLNEKLNVTENVKARYKGRVSQIENEVNAESDKLFKQYKEDGLSDIDARAKANEDTIKYYIADKRQKAVTEAVTVQKIKEMEVVKTADELRAEFVTDPRVSREGSQALDLLSDGYEGIMTHNLAPLIDKYRSRIPGGLDTNSARRVTMEYELSKAAMGEKASVEATQIVKTMNDNYKLAQKLFARTGTPTHFLENRGLPVKWAINKLVGEKNRVAFIEENIKRLDRNKMKYFDGNKMSEEDIRQLVEEVYLSMVTRGQSKLVAAGKFGSGKSTSGLITKRTLGRVLHYKTAKDQLDMHKMFGEGDFLDNILAEQQSIGVDLAIANKFGPRPETVLKSIESRIATDMAKTGKLYKSNKARDLMDYFLGKNEGVDKLWLADAANTLRYTASAVHLGKVPISAMTDIAYARQTAKLYGLNQRSVAGKYISYMMSLNKAERRQRAIQDLAIIDYARGGAHTLGRYSDTEAVGKASAIAQSFADFTVRASGLNAHTRNMRDAIGLAARSELVLNAEKSLDKLSAGNQRLLKETGITATEWDTIRKTAAKNERGVMDFDIDNIDPNIQAKFYGMMKHVQLSATPEARAEVRSMLRGRTRKGTLAGETLGAVTQFMGFPVNQVVQQYRRAMTGSKGVMSVIDVAITGTILGVIATQIYEMANGNDPFSWDSPELYARAAARGPLGFPHLDVVSSLLNKDATKAEIMGRIAGGPSIDLMLNVIMGIVDAGYDIAGWNKKTATPGNLIKVLESVPGTNLWYTQEPLRQLVFNRLRELYDPKYKDQLKRRTKRLKDQGRGLLFDE